MRTRAPSCRGPPRQNVSVPLTSNLSTSWRGSCAVEQVPSGLRANCARPLTVPVKLPVAPVNFPVPPVTCQVNSAVPVNRQLSGLITKGDRGFPVVLSTCRVPPGKTRSSTPTGNRQVTDDIVTCPFALHLPGRPILGTCWERATDSARFPWFSCEVMVDDHPRKLWGSSTAGRL